MRFVTEPFVIVVGGSDIDISESEVVRKYAERGFSIVYSFPQMVTRDSPPELVQSQRHRAAVKLVALHFSSLLSAKG